jgi:hypothetical protein
MQASKILFSEEELSWAENSDWILTKNRIIRKVISLFSSLSDSYRRIAEEKRQVLPDEFFNLSPKISRGEQYLELPYVMLDYPRIFSKEDVFAIRTFFWWGNYFSLTLHLKGSYKDKYREKLLNHQDLLVQNNYWVAISDDEWRHDFEKENYVLLKKGMNELTEKQKTFLKLAVRWPLEDGNSIEHLLEKQFLILLKIITG